MDKYINLQGKSSLRNLKYFTKPNDSKLSQFFSEPSSHDVTPKSAKNSRLEPIGPSFFLKKTFNDPQISPKQGSPRRFVLPDKPDSFRPIVTPKKWLMPGEGELTPQTPQGEKKRYVPSKPLSVGTRDQSKTNGSFSEQLSHMDHGPQSAKNLHKTTFHSDIAPQEQREEEKLLASSRSDSRQKMNGSQSTYRISKRKVLETGLVVARAKGEETMSDNEFNRNVQNLKQDVHATLPFRHLVFGPQIELELFKKHLMIMHKGLVYSTKNLKSPSERFIASKQVDLPKQITRKNKTLLLDLDETLIHSCILRENPDVILTYQGSGSEMARQIPIKIRPHLKDFLTSLSPYYEIVIFTASAAPYAQTIINYLDKSRKHINAILTREHCMETKNGFFIKDLRIIKERDLKDMIIVDNLVHSFGFQIENGVPILEFINDKKDEELKHLKEYLLEAYKHDDLREFNKKNLKLHEFANKNPDEIFQHISMFMK